MASTCIQGTYHNMPVLLHQEDGQTIKRTPGHFCPRCYDPRYRIVDEGFIQCQQCGRCYFVPSQEYLDTLQAREAGQTTG
ncbi:MAG: hypothetical protein AB7N91_09240 [Candidatus Tectimicrobiota bacterium]